MCPKGRRDRMCTTKSSSCTSSRDGMVLFSADFTMNGEAFSNLDESIGD